MLRLLSQEAGFLVDPGVKARTGGVGLGLRIGMGGGGERTRSLFVFTPNTIHTTDDSSKGSLFLLCIVIIKYKIGRRSAGQSACGPSPPE